MASYYYLFQIALHIPTLLRDVKTTILQTKPPVFQSHELRKASAHGFRIAGQFVVLAYGEVADFLINHAISLYSLILSKNIREIKFLLIIFCLLY